MIELRSVTSPVVLPDVDRVVRTLPPSGDVVRAMPADAVIVGRVRHSRAEVTDVLDGRSDRLLVVCGPYDVAETDEAVDMAARLRDLATRFVDDLVLVVRDVRHRLPRTGGEDAAVELIARRARVRDLVRAGMPVAVEYASPILAGYVADLVSYTIVGLIAGRIPEFQRLASILRTPVGFIGRYDKALAPAVEAIRAAAAAQWVTTIDTDTRPVEVITSGNPDGHLIMRGIMRPVCGVSALLAGAAELLSRKGLSQRVVIDASIGTKPDVNQRWLVARMTEAIRDGQYPPAGVLIEPAPASSVDRTSRSGLAGLHEDLNDLASAVRARRQAGVAAKGATTSFTPSRVPLGEDRRSRHAGSSSADRVVPGPGRCRSATARRYVSPHPPAGEHLS